MKSCLLHALLSTATLFFSPVWAQPPQKKLILFPIAYYTPDTSVALGGLAIVNFDKLSEGKTSHAVTSFSYTLKKQSIFVLSPRYYFDNGDKEIYGTLRYMFYPSEYYGRGNETLKSNKQTYTQNILALDLGVKTKIASHFFVAPFISQQDIKLVQIEEGGDIEQELLAGYGEFKQNGYGTIVGWDTRDYPNAPLSGAYYHIMVSRNWSHDPHNAIADPHYERQQLNLKNYIPVGEKRVLAIELRLDKIDGHSVPFPLLNKLGGPVSLRGYLSGRYRDKSMGLAQIDYRHDLNERWAFSVFSGLGVVGADMTSLTQNRRRHCVGTGLHYIADTENRQKFRFDISVGEQDFGFYVVLGEAF